LTGAGNRRALESAARAALAAAARTNTPLSLAVIDLDGLKTINDTEGHAAGDKVLGGLSTALRAALRETDQLFRVGGDEFVVLLPLAPPDAVVHLMQRAEHFRAPSFSWGVASAPTDATELADLLQIADARLYAARRAAGYYDGRSSSAGAPAPAPPVTTPPPPAPVHRHRARTLVLAGALSVGGVVGFVLMLPGAPKASSTNPPPPGQLPPSGAANGPGASGPAAGPGPSGATLSGPSGAGTSSPTGTSGTSATGSSPAPSGTTTPGSGGGGPSGPSTTTSSTTTTAPSGGPQQPGITLPPPPIGTSGLNTGTGL
jgi:diguanylate cyclase (GGDEF)-like protein